MINHDIFKKGCTFLKSVAAPSGLPTHDLPEIAFAGRSNVGKSSMINALFNNKKIARTSNTPGRTQHLNFFSVQEEFYFVDMPGYGFAQAPKKIIVQWQKLMQHYLNERTNLKRVYILIDSRHGLKDNDRDFMHYLDQIGLSYQIVLTKIDKISDNQLLSIQEQTHLFLKEHAAAYPEILSISSEKKKGINALQIAIVSLCTASQKEDVL